MNGGGIPTVQIAPVEMQVTVGTTTVKGVKNITLIVSTPTGLATYFLPVDVAKGVSAALYQAATGLVLPSVTPEG